MLLVQQHDAGQILAGLAACERSEASAELVCSTAHRAKGREWNYVLLDADFEAGFLRGMRSPRPNKLPTLLQSAGSCTSLGPEPGLEHSYHARSANVSAFAKQRTSSSTLTSIFFYILA